MYCLQIPEGAGSVPGGAAAPAVPRPRDGAVGLSLGHLERPSCRIPPNPAPGHGFRDGSFCLSRATAG